MTSFFDHKFVRTPDGNVWATVTFASILWEQMSGCFLQRKGRSASAIAQPTTTQGKVFQFQDAGQFAFFKSSCPMMNVVQEISQPKKSLGILPTSKRMRL